MSKIITRYKSNTKPSIISNIKMFVVAYLRAKALNISDTYGMLPINKWDTGNLKLLYFN